jgi:hypothetical protein
MAKVFDSSFAGSSGGGTTSAINTSGSGCKLIVVTLSTEIGGTPTLSDSVGNTYTALTARTGTNYRARIYYCINPTLSATHTWTCGGGSTFPVLVAMGFDDTVTYEAESGAGNIVGNPQPGSITPSVNGAVIVACYSGSNGAAPTINSSFTVVGGVGTTGQQVGGGGAWLIQATAAAINPSWTVNDVNGNNANAMAVFVPSGGGGGGSTNGIAFGPRGGRALNAGKTFVGGIRRAALQSAHDVGDRIARAVQRERFTFGEQLLAGINS